MSNNFGPIRRDYTLASGRPVVFEQPDMLAFASGKIEMPSQAKLDVWHLLYRAGVDDPAQQLLSDERYARSLYYAAQLVITPRVRLDDDDEGEIDRRELALPDLLAAYTFLRFGPPAPAARRDDRAGETAAHSGGDVPQGAE